MANKVLNFRCPDNLLAAIDEIGRQRYPADNENGCDRSKTLLDLLQAGIFASSGETVELKSKTNSKTQQELMLEFKSELMNDVRQIVDSVRQEMDEKLQTALGESRA